MKFTLAPFLTLAAAAANVDFHPSFSGYLHHGTSLGHLTTIANISTYITGSARSRNTILYLTDIFGHNLTNAHLLADKLASAGNLVVVPDLFNGDPIPFPLTADFDFPPWIAKHNDASVEGILGAFRAALKGSRYETETLTAVGYCFGARYVVRLLAEEGALVAGYIAHPGNVTPEDLAQVKGPLSVAAAEVDTAFPKELRWAGEVALAGTGVRWEIKLWQGVEHGFAVRWEKGEEWAEWVAREAREQAVGWFKNFVR